MMGKLKLSTSSQCIKYLMFIFNLLFVITGIILISIGSVINGIYYKFEHFLDDKFFSVPSLLIATGTIIFFIAFFGCCGAIKENYCMIVTFAVLMVIIFIFEISAGISGYVLRSSAKETIQKKMLENMENYNTSTGNKKIWDTLQQELECCGANDENDWIKIWTNQTAKDEKWLPMSCCKPVLGEVGKAQCNKNSDSIHKVGCLTVVTTFITTHAVELGGAGIGIAFVQGLGIWFSIFLAKQIKRSYENM